MLLMVVAWPPWPPSLPPRRRVLQPFVSAYDGLGFARGRAHLDMSRAPPEEALLPSVMVE